MARYLPSLLCLLLLPTVAVAQLMDTTRYRDTTIQYIEQELSRYNFTMPIESDVVNDASFTPPDDGVYLLATYGHRYLSSTSNKTDNHGGFDYWSDHVHNGTTYDDNNPAPIICMCDGVISAVINGPDSLMELTATGRSVQVTCDSAYQSFGNAIKINYRHLSALDSLASIADTAAANSIEIHKGDVIGLMGESGTTSNVHLHMSTQTDHPGYGNAFVNTARLFDPTANPHILEPLRSARLEMLHNWADSALFRITWPYNQTINRFEFTNNAFSIVFDKEAAYDTGAAIRDNHNCIPGVRVYAYQFNGKLTAAARYQNEMGNIPAHYPASPQRDADLATYGYAHIPITYDSVAYVYDFVIDDISSQHFQDDWVVRVSDVWGYTVEGTFDPTGAVGVQEEARVRYFPNPATDQLSIAVDKAGAKTILLFDVTGRQVLHSTSKDRETTLNLSTLGTGLYVLAIKVEDRVVTRHVIKQ